MCWFLLNPYLTVDLSICIIWMIPFLVLGFSCGCFHFYCIFHRKVYVNSEELDQTPYFVASEQGLHCLHNTPDGYLV